MRSRRLSLAIVITSLVGALSVALAQELPLRLPVKANSVRFLVIGDSGTGDTSQYEIGGADDRTRARSFRSSS